MHDDRKRQLLALSTALWLGFGAFGADRPAASTNNDPLADRLAAAKLVEAGLFAGDAGPAEWRKMDRIYEDLAAKFPKSAKVRAAQGELLWARGERDRALAAWEAAATLDPADAAVLDHLSGAWLALGNVRKAAGFAQRAVASQPEHAGYRFALANLSFLFRHELTDAAHDSESVLRLALSHFAAASRLAPDNSDFARAYAETFYSVKAPDWRAALDAWQHFEKITHQKDFARVNLARVHLKLGQKETAREYLARLENPAFNNIKRRLEEQASPGTATVGGPAEARP